MQYTLIEKGEVQFDESSLFLEGAVLAANLTTKPLAPETWLEPLLGEGFKALQPVIEEQIHKQHNYILRNEYSILALTNDDSDQLADFAEGFMSVWSMIEEQWHDTRRAQRWLRAYVASFAYDNDASD